MVHLVLLASGETAQSYHVFERLFQFFEECSRAGETLFDYLDKSFLPDWIVEWLTELKVPLLPGLSSWSDVDLFWCLGAGILVFLVVSLFQFFLNAK